MSWRRRWRRRESFRPLLVEKKKVFGGENACFSSQTRHTLPVRSAPPPAAAAGLPPPPTNGLNSSRDGQRPERACGDLPLRPPPPPSRRASGTEPVIRVMVEGQDEDQVVALARRLADVVAEAAA